MLEVAQLLTQSGPHVTLFQNRFDSESRLLFRAENNNSSAAFSLRLNCHLLQAAPVNHLPGSCGTRSGGDEKRHEWRFTVAFSEDRLSRTANQRPVISWRFEPVRESGPGMRLRE